MKRFAGFLGLLLVAGLYGCSSIAVKTDYDRDFDFARFQSFTWMPRPSGKKQPNTIAKNSLLDKRIRKAVESQLDAKGFEVRKGGRTDALLAYHVALQEHVDVTRFGYGRRWYRGGRVHRHRYRDGTLIIDIVDPASKELIWRGSATRAIYSLNESEEKINEAMAKLFEKYPPG
jgi:hypothetical protein